MDDWFNVILTPAIVAAVVAAIGTWIGAGLQDRRDHRRWLREQRYEAYVKFEAFYRDATSVSRALSDLRNQPERTDNEADIDDLSESIANLSMRADKLLGGSADALSPLVVLGPNAVAIAADEMLSQLAADERTRQTTAHDAFKAAVHKVLKIPDR